MTNGVTTTISIGAIDMQLRRVVTGHNESGQSVVTSDELVSPFEMGPAAWGCSIWGRDDGPVFPDHGELPSIGNGLPPVGGFRFGVMILSAGGTPQLDRWVVETYGESADPDRPGMHHTQSLDLVVVLEGEIAMQMDNGDEVVLRRNDFVIQNGTNHRWENRGQSDAVIAVTVIGADVSHETRSVPLN
jgi:mannose-6-phosphate isomerase-like protein (cupin superfamily)